MTPTQLANRHPAMTDTIEQHCKMLASLHKDLDIGDPRHSSIDAAITALSARASAGEGGEWVMVPRRLTAENGAKGLLSGEFAEYFEMSCGECASVDDKDAEHCDVCDGKGVYRVAIPVGWDTIKKIHRMVVENLATAAPQPAQAGASGGGKLLGWAKAASDGQPMLHTATESVEQRDAWVLNGWTAVPLYTTPASPATGEDFEAWFAKQDSRTEWRELVRLAYYATPQPKSARGKWGDWLESQSDDDLLTIFAFRPDLAERLRAIIATTPASPDTKVENPYEVGSADWQAYSRYLRNRRATPPAHGDGEGLLVHVGDALSHAFPEDIAEWKRVCRIVYPFLRERLTTRPAPEAQEARDAARYRAIRNAGWEPNGNAALFAAIETAMTGEQLDDCIDAALALPAQGREGDRG